MGWIIAVGFGLPFLAFALWERRRRDLAAQRSRDHGAARATELAERLGWSPPRLDPSKATWLLRGAVGEAQVLVRLSLHGDWAKVELRGRRFLPEGFEVRRPGGFGPDPLEREPANFATDVGVGLLVTPLERFTEPSSPWGAVARSMPGREAPHVTSDLFAFFGFAIPTTDDAVSVVRLAVDTADAWVAATAEGDRRDIMDPR
ncbi:MAG: hypothetical protein U0414_38185 [Polyangiaceae bacterium]